MSELVEGQIHLEVEEQQLSDAQAHLRFGGNQIPDLTEGLVAPTNRCVAYSQHIRNILDCLMAIAR